MRPLRGPGNKGLRPAASSFIAGRRGSGIVLETPSPGPWALLGSPVLTHLVSLSPFPEHMLSLLRAQEPGVGVGGDGGLWAA